RRAAAALSGDQIEARVRRHLVRRDNRVKRSDEKIPLGSGQAKQVHWHEPLQSSRSSPRSEHGTWNKSPDYARWLALSHSGSLLTRMEGKQRRTEVQVDRTKVDSQKHRSIFS